MFESVFPSFSSILAVAGIGLFFGIVLSVAKIKLHVDKDVRIEEIISLLPGANCGACGFPGCSGYASGIVGGKCDIALCPGCSDENRAKIAAVMGMEPVAGKTPLTARIHCHGGAAALNSYEYSGPVSCGSAAGLMNGPKICSFGCLGLGDCVSACLFDAIHMGKNGVPEVDSRKCTGCRKCVEACPRSVISLAPVNIGPVVLCKNREKGPVMKKGCPVGCIGCKICEKNCPEGAITVTDFCASIDYEKCTSCMKCAELCPVPVVFPVEKSKKYQKQLSEAEAAKAAPVPVQEKAETVQAQQQ